MKLPEEHYSSADNDLLAGIPPLEIEGEKKLSEPESKAPEDNNTEIEITEEYRVRRDRSGERIN